MSTNLFDKVKKSLDTGFTTVSAKSKETVEIVKLKSQIKDLHQRVREEQGNLGDMVYTMFKDDDFSKEIIDDKCRAILVIEQEIKIKEEEIVASQLRTQSAIEATKTEFICPRCSMSISKDSKFCPKCSLKIEASGPKCECGQVLELGAKFCVGCGQKIEVQVQVQVQVPFDLVCSQCSKPIEPSAVFCTHCGAKQVSD